MAEFTTYIMMPAYNEAPALPPLMDKIQALSRDTGLALRVVVVDDGSSDATADIARAHELSARGVAEVVAHPHNMGLGAGVRTSMNTFLARAQQGDVLVLMDADDTQDPADIPALMAALDRGADVAIASRFVQGGGEVGVSLPRRIFSRGARLFLRLAAPVPNVRDYSCGFRAYRFDILHRAQQVFGDKLVESPHFSVMSELLIKLSAVGAVFDEIPFTVRYDRKEGPSKIKLAATLWGYFGLIWLNRRARRLAAQFKTRG